LGKFETYLYLFSEHIADFHYEIYIGDGNRFGKKQPDGSYDGMSLESFFLPSQKTNIFCSWPFAPG
jgi:hypothetical protein